MLRTDLIQPVSDLLRRQATLLGNKTAFDDGARTVSFGDLEARTRRIAGHLGALGLQPGDRVAMLLGERVEMVESYFAVARAGAIGVPVSRLVSGDELAWLLDDSGAAAVITEPAGLEKLDRLRRTPAPAVVLAGAGVRDHVGCLSYERFASTEPPAQARDDLALDDVAWMLYTAGTTGRPKGVLSTQRNCLWSVAACYVPALGLGPDDRVLWPLPLSHSLSHIACVLAVTAVGAHARIAGELSTGDLLRILDEDRATVLTGVPTTYHYLVREARLRGFTPAGLRVALVGGAPTAPQLRRAVEKLCGAPLVDAYGSTETCGSIAVNWPTRGRVADSCGIPVLGLAVRLVAPDTFLDIPDGEEGEVWVRGPNIMVGYHNQPEATAEAFKDGWYRTGDLARRDPSGYLTITGRITELIIRAGENIHPAEVEDVLRAVPGVADAAVVGRPHSVFGEVPVAFVVPSPGGFDPGEALRACREKLSANKLPDGLYEVSEIPRTAYGKIARHRLVDIPTRLRAVGDAGYESLFRVDWVPLPTVSRHGYGLGRWAVVGARAAEFATALRAVGASASTYPDLAALRTEVARGLHPPQAILLALPEPGPATADWMADSRPGEHLERLLTWLEDKDLAPCLLVLLTSHAVSTGPGEPVGCLQHVPLWGLARSLQASYPGRLAIADLADPVSAGALPAVLRRGEHQIAVRSGVALVPRLTRVSAEPGGSPIVPFGGPGTVVVTGADTVPGSAIARHLVQSYNVGNLLLIVEPGRATVAEECRCQLAEAGADVRLAECDLGRRQALSRALAKVSSPVAAVVHAWQPENRPVAEAFASTAAGARHLSELLWSEDLSAFVMFSTASGLIDAAGRPHEAVCAAFLDAFAVHLRSEGVPALSLSWGPWESGTADGTAALTDRQGLAMFDAALSVDHAHLVAMKLDADELSHPIPPLLRGLAEAPDRPAGVLDSTEPRVEGQAVTAGDAGLRVPSSGAPSRTRSSSTSAVSSAGSAADPNMW